MTAGAWPGPDRRLRPASVRPLGGADAAPGDVGGDDADEQLPVSGGPRLAALRGGASAVGLGHVVGRALEQPDPALPPGRVDLVDLEGDLVLAARDRGLQI